MARDRRLFLKSQTAAQYVGMIVERQLAAAGIPSHLFALLTHIRHAQPVTPSGISAAAGIPMTTLRDNIQRLVDRRLVERRPNPADGRSYLVAVTTRGEVLARAADPALAQAYDALEQALERPLEEFERVLDELAAALERTLRELEGAAPSASVVAREPVADD